jgi:pimeloyl-ACP methyl ester carboxylesterase
VRGAATSPDGLPIRFEVDGTGVPALVFVHGWSCDRSYWRHQTRAFANRYQVVTIDLAGHGESGIERASWTMAAFGADVAAVTDELALTKVVFIGHSMGGDVIVEAALLLGDRVCGLVWVDTYQALGAPAPPEEHEAFAMPFRADFASETRAFVRRMFLPTSDPALVEWVAQDMSSAPPGIAIQALWQAISNDGPILAGLRQITAPVVSIHPAFRPPDEASLARYGVRAVVMPDVGHFPMLEDPPRFNAILGDVLDDLGPVATDRSRGS